MPVANANVLVSGAGIAGSALAFWLKRYGFNPTVVEQAPTPREGGYIFHFHGKTGIEVLKRMGLWAVVMKQRRVDKKTVFMDQSNVPIVRLDTAPTTASVEASGMQVTAKRTDVACILYDSTKDSVDYIFGDSVRALREVADGIDVEFESGRTSRFDLVVGADGLRSEVRKLAFGDEERCKRFLGYCVGAFTVRDYPSEYGVDVVYTVPGKLLTLVGVSKNSPIAIFIFRRETELTHDSDDAETQKQLPLDVFESGDWKTPNVRELLSRSSDFFFDSVSQIRMDRWSTGRVAVVGDAAYCPTQLSGHGAQLGLVGAYVLAGELKTASGDYRTAFAAMNVNCGHSSPTRRRTRSAPRTHIPQSAFGMWVRDRVLKLVPVPSLSQLVLKLTHGRLLRDTFTLKDYEHP